MTAQMSKPNHSVAISNNTSYPNFSSISPVLLFGTFLWACCTLPTNLATSRWQLGNNHTEQIPQGQRFEVPTMAYIVYSMWTLLAKQKSAGEGAAVEDETQYNSPTRGGAKNVYKTTDYYGMAIFCINYLCKCQPWSLAARAWEI